MLSENEIKQKFPSFLKSLEILPDKRDNRGKRHDLKFVLAGTMLAIMNGRAKVSSIHRYIINRLVWLKEILTEPEAKEVSRAQLPRILAGVDWQAFNQIVAEYFGVKLEKIGKDKWVAVDGKSLRGTTSAENKQGQRLITAVTHTERETVAQQEMGGAKKSEITAVRTLLEESGLKEKQITLDALHLNPKTTALINQAEGAFIIPAKQNQKELCQALNLVVETTDPVATIATTGKGHGRLEERVACFFDIQNVTFADRWSDSGFSTLVVMMRQNTYLKQGKVTNEVAYYLSNKTLPSFKDDTPKRLFAAVRGHWGVESENWIRDVTFHEDDIRTSDPNQTQVMASLRTLAIRLFRHARSHNFQERIERFSDCPDDFVSFLHQVNFL